LANLLILPAMLAVTPLRKSALGKVTMISLRCNCIATCRMAKREKKPRQITLPIALMPPISIHAERF